MVKLWAWNTTPKIMGPTIKHDYPEVEDAVRYNNITFLSTVGEKKLNVRGAFADTGFLNMFSFPSDIRQCHTALARQL